MLEDALLRELILTYALALVLIVALARLRIPPVVALIATGAIAGPGGIRIVRTQEDVQLLAEIGIVLLLFTVGLDFSLGDFRRVWRRVVGAGVLQIGVTAAVVVGVVVAATDRPLPLAVFAGLFVALSSTAIVVKELSGRNQLDAPHGRLVVGDSALPGPVRRRAAPARADSVRADAAQRSTARDRTGAAARWRSCFS